jgi:hypothetical protein
MRSRHTPALLIALAIAWITAACQSDIAKHAERAAAVADTVDGGELESQMWRAIEAKNWPKVDSMLADGFQSAHADGGRDRAGEIALLRTLNPGRVIITESKTTKQGAQVIVTYKISVEETIDGKALSSLPAVRQSVWQYTPTGWKWIAHSNLRPL